MFRGTAFAPSARCIPRSSSARARTRKTPRADAKDCVGKVRIGQNSTYMYFARPHAQHNPTFRTSPRIATAQGAHRVAKWDKVYDARTGKALKVKDVSGLLQGVRMNVLY